MTTVNIKSRADEITEDIMDKMDYLIVEVQEDTAQGVSNIGMCVFIGAMNFAEKVSVVDPADQYLWLFKRKNLYIFNTAFVHIINIHIGSTSKISYAFDDKQQGEAISILLKIVDYYRSNGKLTKNGYLPVSEFKNIPEALLKEVESFSNKVASTTKSTSTTTTAGGTTVKTAYTGGYTSYAKPISTTTFKRTTKYPIGAALRAMAAKLALLREGKYTRPPLPSIPNDGKDQGRKNHIDEDAQHRFSGYYGM